MALRYPLDRRTVLRGMAAAGAIASLPELAFGATTKKKAKARRGVLLGGMRAIDPGTKATAFALSQVDLDSDRRRTIPLHFFAHGVTRDPLKPGRALIFEKRGPGAAEVDLEAGRFVRPLKTFAERAFYGHAAFSKDGSQLFVAESHLATHKGVVSVWDGKTLAQLGDFPTFGENPHDVKLLDDGTTLVVTNGGGLFPSGDPPCVTFIDIQSRKLLEKLTFDNPRINAGHVKITKKGELAVTSAPRDGISEKETGAISLRHAGQKLVTMTKPEEVVKGMTGETLSLAIHEPTGTVVATSPAGNQLSFWSLGEQRLIKSLTVDNPRGVTKTLDEQHFVVCHGATATLTFFSTRTLEEEPSLKMEKTLVAGSHIYAWDGELA